MWSYEVSQMVGSFQQQSMMQAGYANSIGMMNPGFAGNVAAGSALNMAGSIAAPAAALGMGLVGADPLSMGMRAGAAAFPSMGLGGAMAAGVGVAAPMAGLMYGAQAMGQQVMTGMQQQQQLAMGLRGSMGGFMNGGMGPSNADVSLIGNQIRSMTHKQGAGGEVHGFNELSSLAQNMGQMGFTQKASDVKQFSQKFREMIETVKTISRDLGTTLESAQQAVVGMRGSGLFNASDQLKMSSAMRSNSVTGNIAMGESSAMANIGSQIARSIGGRGSSGAFAGVKTLGQIGQAVQMGVLSEEQIYNATGLTGAEGQRAMATSMMTSSARFLKSGKGRFMLAAMAGQNGEIDEGALDEFMSGGMGVGRTRQLAGQGLARTGRAGFLRNEGRLASSLMEKVGGNVNTLALMGWAGQHGIDVEGMGDREMIFAQRQLGMGRDEMEAAVTMARKLPEMREFAKMKEGQDKYLSKVRQQQGRTGIEGVKNDFNAFREKIQGGLQKVGQDIYSDASDYVEKYIRTLTGEAATAMTDQIEEAYMRYKMEGASGGQGTSEIGAIMRNAKAFGGASAGHASAGKAMGSYESYRRHAQNKGVGGMLSGLLGGKSLEDRTGYHLVGEGEGAVRALKDRVDALREGATTPAGLETAKLAASAAEGLKSSIGLREKLAGAHGDDYLKVMGEVVGKYGDESLKTEWANLSSGSPGPERSRKLGQLAQTISNQAGMNANAQFVAHSASPFSLAGGGHFATEKQRLEAYGKDMMAGYAGAGQINRTTSEIVKESASGFGYLAVRAKEGLAAASTPGGLARTLLDPLGLYTAQTRQMSGKEGITRDTSLAAAKYLRTAGGRERLGALHGDKVTSDDMTSAQRRLDDILQGRSLDELASDERGEYEAIRTGLVSAKLRGAKTDEEREGIVKEDYQGKLSLKDFRRQELGQQAAIGAESMHSAAAIIRRAAGMSGKELESLRASGVYDANTAGLTAASTKGLSPHLAKVLSAKVGAMQKEVLAGRTPDSMEGIQQFLSSGDSRAEAQGGLWSMSSSELSAEIQKIQSGKTGAGGDVMLEDLRKTRRNLQRTQSLVGRRGANLAATSLLGIEGLSREQMLDLRGAKDEKSYTARLKGMGYDLSEEGTRKLQHAVKGLRTKEYSELDDRDGKVHTYRGEEAMQRATAALKKLEEGELGKAKKEAAKARNEEENPVLVDIRTILNSMKGAQEAATQQGQKVNIGNWSDLALELKKPGG